MFKAKVTINLIIAKFSNFQKMNQPNYKQAIWKLENQ